MKQNYADVVGQRLDEAPSLPIDFVLDAISTL